MRPNSDIDSDAINLIQTSLGSYPMALSEIRLLAGALLSPPAAAIRLRPDGDPTTLPFTTTGVPWHARGFQVESTIRPARFLPYPAGQYYIQDAASLLAVRLLAVSAGELICDLCAAPGGKTTAILEDLGNTGWVVANEPIQSRVSVLEFSLARHGSTRFVVTNLDPEQLADRASILFDAVLVDAPCTGQSLVGRNKQSWSSFSRHQIEHSASRQARILESAARLVGTGGRLVYSTCTFSDQENELLVTRFLRQHPEFILEECADLGPYESELLAGTYRLWPHCHSSGGAFAARLRKQEIGVLDGDITTHRMAKQPVQSTDRLPFDILEWGRLAESTFVVHGPRCFAWSAALPVMLADWAYIGPEIAYRAGNTWFPSYGLAMRRDANWYPHRTVELTSQESSQFVSGQVIPCPISGWCIATWEGHPLGWLKGDGRRGKNHLPKPARLEGVRDV